MHTWSTCAHAANSACQALTNGAIIAKHDAHIAWILKWTKQGAPSQVSCGGNNGVPLDCVQKMAFGAFKNKKPLAPDWHVSFFSVCCVQIQLMSSHPKQNHHH